MRAITVPQPQAALIAAGAKTTLTRDRPLPNEALDEVVAIHAGRQVDRELLQDELAQGILGDQKLASGALVAIARLLDSIRTDDSWPGAQELHFGDFDFGAHVWRLVDVQPLTTPVGCRGARGLFELSPKVTAQVLATTGPVVSINAHDPA